MGTGLSGFRKDEVDIFTKKQTKTENLINQSYFYDQNYYLQILDYNSWVFQTFDINLLQISLNKISQNAEFRILIQIFRKVPSQTLETSFVS